MYVIILIQFIMWSGYTLIEWLSSRDQLIYKVIMFFVFFYLAFLLGRKMTKSPAKALFITSLSLAIYSSLHFTFIHFGGI